MIRSHAETRTRVRTRDGGARVTLGGAAGPGACGRRDDTEEMSRHEATLDLSSTL